MQNFKIGFNSVKHFFKSNLYLGRIYWQKVKSDFILKNKSIFTFKATGLDTPIFDKKITYNYITRFKLCLSLYPFLILTRTPFKAHK